MSSDSEPISSSEDTSDVSKKSLSDWVNDIMFRSNLITRRFRKNLDRVEPVDSDSKYEANHGQKEWIMQNDWINPVIQLKNNNFPIRKPVKSPALIKDNTESIQKLEPTSSTTASLELEKKLEPTTSTTTVTAAAATKIEKPENFIKKSIIFTIAKHIDTPRNSLRNKLGDEAANDSGNDTPRNSVKSTTSNEDEEEAAKLRAAEDEKL